ncbi:nitrous oxide-stimulated promoter family protein [Geomonas sp. RF6]|nr:nitrous oxide-stimulated promoter family protein [Geomonas sp. RF6]UFS69498.1 nitrous oxide-stimulated promoter family protein [Geomonas sp. RF6]
MPLSVRQIEREKRTILHMVQIYCACHRHVASGICAECTAVVR